MQPSPKSALAGIFFLALSVILFEIALTRVFAIMMWHHFTYMVISIGLLGFGAAGSLMTATRVGLKGGNPARALTWISGAYGVSVMFAFCFATLVRLDSLAIWKEKENFVALFFIYLIVGVPFLLGGLGIGLALTRHVKDVNRLYFSDLLGSALGAGLAAVLLRGFGSSATVMMAGGFGLLAAFCFGLGAPRRYLVVTVPGLLLGAVVAIAFGGGSDALGVPAARWRVPFAPGKEGALAESLGFQIERIFSATAEVEVGPDVQASPAFGGDNGLLDSKNIRTRTAAQDGTAPTMLYADASNLAQFPFLDDTQAASAYVTHKASERTDHKVMVIGVGGGVDVMVALANGAGHVTAVELNTGMIEMVRERHAEYLGHLFTPGAHPLADRIELVNSEGRAWLRTRPDKYDVIQMSGVDSYTALSTGAYTLSESYLYTTQAVQDFYEHLTDDGIVCYSRFVANRPMKPRETLRLTNIAGTALRELGVADPGRHVAVFQGITWASTMIKRSPFTATEIEALREFARIQGFVGLIYDPLRPKDAPFTPEPQHFSTMREELLGAIARHQLASGLPAHTLLRELMQAAAQIADGAKIDDAIAPPSLRGTDKAAVALQLLRDRKAEIAAQSVYVMRTLNDFASVMQDDDAARAAFVADYEYNISPSTDDKPFFFNYYKYSNLWSGAAREADPSLFRYHTDFPVGHMVLLASVVQILLLAAAMIFLPLRKLSVEGLRTEGVWRYFGYFAALGLGFMFVEITLMQKMVIFLGHPTYALSVVLASLLAAAGTGSLLAGRIREVQQKHVRWIVIAIAAVVLFDLMAVNWLLPLLLGLSLEMRIVVVVVLLLPTGLVLGVPFPTGMRVLEKQCPHLLPWGWAVNAFFSVFASIFCIVLSMAIGFTNVLLVSVVIYAVGLSALRITGDSAPAPAPPPQ
ncbi:MAG: spermidine synthase [Planctomycetota bacterium]